MRIWQLQDAKSHLSEVVRLCTQHGPQMLTVRGKEEAVLISKKDYERLIGEKPNLLDFMKQSPLYDLDIVFEHDQSKNREIDL
ncbi:MAG: type II toxin-antitoxin system Phd/YefM family antitoxin [Alphaproteobacteria bacterium]|nr:type II toxin-antitoxin system Phd/YefM family antitoxin [Alphaproteobacteria bacterium]